METVNTNSKIEEESESIELEETNNNNRLLQSNYEKFLIDMRINLNKCKYRKVLDDVKSKENIFFSISDNWKLNELKIRAMLKIIHKKLFKVEKNQNSNNNNEKKTKSIESWFVKLDLEIDKLMSILHPSEEFEDKLDLFVQLFLEEIYLLAKHSKNEMNIADCAAFLALGEKIIKVYTELSRNPKTINIAQKVILFISSLLISDKDFETAKTYLSNSLKLCFRELFLRININDGLDYDRLSKSKQYYFNKIFVHITIAFYQRGVCEENLANLVKAIECYKQSRWFAIKFVKTQMPELSQFIYDVEKRALDFNQLVTNIIVKNEELKKKSSIIDKQLKDSQIMDEEKRMALTMIANGNYIKLNKFDHTRSIIEKLNFPEFEFDTYKRNNEHKTKDTILSTVHLIDNLVSDEFKDILKNLKNVRISNIDKETQEKLQRRLNELRAEKIFIKRKNELKNSIETQINKNPFIRNSSNTNSHADNFSSTNFSQKETNIKNISNFTPTIPNNLGRNGKGKTLRMSKSEKNFSPHCKLKPNSVEKIKYDEFVFSNEFQKKISYINKIEEKEIKFQKQLLKLKKFEKLTVEKTNMRNIQKEVKQFFNRAKSTRTEISLEKNSNKLNQDKIHEKNKKTKCILENFAIMSLEPKRLSNLRTFLKKEATIPNVGLREEFVTKYNELNTKTLADKFQVNKKNKQVIKQIEKELDDLDKEKCYYESSLSPKKFTQLTKLPSKLIDQNGKTFKNMDKFLKIK